jgi:hypothetical protein
LKTDPRNHTDDDLIARVSALASRSRETTAELIAHLVELERRRLHLACGFKSLFGYCRRVLHCSEAGSYDRMQAAHAARRFPVVIPMLADGLLHLTAVRLLSPHLEDANHLALLGAAIHKSVREVRAILACWFPKPDVAASVRKLPEPRSDMPNAPCPPAPPETLPFATAEALPLSTASEFAAASPVRPAAYGDGVPRSRVAPLSPARYEVRFTADEETKDLLREAQELLSHSLPGGDIATIVKRGLTLVVAEAKRARFAQTDRPRDGRSSAPDSRAIPTSVQRAVWARDGGRCAFVGRTGHRCEERSFLEYHHRTPWIAGGPPSVENIALRCRAHNQYEAKVYFDPIRIAMSDGH